MKFTEISLLSWHGMDGWWYIDACSFEMFSGYHGSLLYAGRCGRWQFDVLWLREMVQRMAEWRANR